MPAEQLLVSITDANGTSVVGVNITGSVGVASSTISPAALDLGTACVGHDVSGQVLLTNTGTANIDIQPPVADQGFTAAFTDPPSYPGGEAKLVPGAIASTTVSPTSGSAGVYSGTLTWIDNVPNTYTVPLSLTYKSEGTALSPLDLAFGTVKVGIESPPALVRLENCGTTPTTVTVGSVNPVNGTADAWHVTPSGPQTLSAHDSVTVAVTFSPLYPDHYNASLQLVVDDAPAAVQLDGNGSGTANERTFYGCGCQGGGSPRRSAPFALAVLAIIVRRRRGSS